MKRLLKNKKGQAAVEFIFVALVIFFFLFFLLSISIVLTVSTYIDYATFMAARTYKAGASGEDIQKRNAETVFNSYFDKIQGLARRPTLSFGDTEESNPNTSGITATYQMDLFYIPPLFIGGSSPSQISLSTETHLGRDPSFKECQSFFRGFAQRFGVNDGRFVDGMEDNGC
jgi:Flp pilus assembly protein TadG